MKLDKPIARPDIDNVLMQQILVVFDSEHQFVGVKTALVVGYEVAGQVKSDKTIQLELEGKEQLAAKLTKKQIEGVIAFHKAMVDLGLKQV